MVRGESSTIRVLIVIAEGEASFGRMPALQLERRTTGRSSTQLETDLAYRETSEYLKVFSHRYIVAGKTITVAIEQKRSRVIEKV